jgi:hypothetical protein
VIIFLRAEGAVRQASHTMFVAPAAQIEGEVPAHWKDVDGEPITIPVEFKYGRAEVPDDLGKFMLKFGHAAKSPLILQPAQVLKV